MKKFSIGVYVCLILVLIASSLVSAAPATKELTVLKFVCPWVKTDISSLGSIKYIERVNTMGKDLVRIDWVGGPEVVPPFENFASLKKGLFDMSSQVAAYMMGQVKGLSVEQLVGLPPSQMRKVGLLNYFDQLCRKDAGIVYVGMVMYQRYGHMIGTNKPKMGESLDWSGLKVRASPMMRHPVVALKGSPVLTPVTEMYSSIEKGVVDALICPSWNYRDFSLPEVVKYFIQPGLPYAITTEVVMRESVWEKLSAEVRKILTDAMVETEKEMEEYYLKKFDEEKRYMVEKGMKQITQPPQIVEEFQKIAVKVLWQELVVKEAGERAAELLQKTKPYLFRPVE